MSVADVTAVTGTDLTLDGQQPADVRASAVLLALIRGGRFADAATYYPMVDDPVPAQHVQLLLAAGWFDDAHAVLGRVELTPDRDDPWLEFLRRVDMVIRANVQSFPDLITASAAFAGHPFVPLLMLRAADAVGHPEAAAHYASVVVGMLPGDAGANRAYAIDMIRRTEYVDAVHRLDVAEQLRCLDEPSPLQDVLAETTPAQALALTLIGRFLHRETDPTQPRTDAERAARRRWREAYRPHAHRLRRRRFVWAATLAPAAGVSIAVGNALPSLLVTIAVVAWTRSRPLPGLDLRTSQIVRALSDPLQVIKLRRYRPIDVFTFIFACVLVGGFATQLPHRPSWLGPLEALVVVALAVLATRGRRRWVRRERERLLPQPLDPSRCRCLDIATLRGTESCAYVDEHLFPVGVAPGAPAPWDVLQCLETHTRFLNLPHATLTLRLHAAPPTDSVPAAER